MSAKAPQPADLIAPVESELGEEDPGSALEGLVRPASQPVSPGSGPVKQRPTDAGGEDEARDPVGLPPR